MASKNVNFLIDRLNTLIKEYIKTQYSIEAEKESFLLEMEYTPLPENEILQSVVDNIKTQQGHIPESTVPACSDAPDRSDAPDYSDAQEYPDSVYYPNDLTPADYAIYQDIVLNRSALPSSAKEKEIKDEALSVCKDLVSLQDINGISESTGRRIKNQITGKIERFFLTRKLGNVRSLTSRSLDSILYRYTARDGFLSMNSIRKICFPSKSASEYLTGFLSKADDSSAGKILQLLKKVRDIMGIRIPEETRSDSAINKFAEVLFQEIRRSFPKDRIMELVLRNPYYENAFKTILDSRQRNSHITQVLLNAIPETYPELFPLARQMQRHFVLHAGPTNSGKSYSAIEALKEANTGVYLAPLRLLAYEKYEELNEDGVYCSLKTGEEEIIIPGATIRSSTIEVLDFSKSYDVAVIDEAQMLNDPQRGSAWTMALLGVQADTVHVCLAPEAQEVLIRIIEACGDTYEIMHHERLVPLIPRKYDKPVFPNNVMKGDAFIVYSRRDVHAAASELMQHGWKCSVIYGNLPYDVRRGEVRRYTEGETDVVVATDAIGMGLNLPIKRIVFLQMSKFDGTEERDLLPVEIRQVAGRAGRFGIFSEGIVTSDADYQMLENALTETPEQILTARIGFPYSLIGIDGRVSELMDRWSRIKPKPGFDVADMSREIALAKILENDTSDKDLVYRFVMFPFDEKNDDLKNIWYELFKAELNGQSDFMKWLPLQMPGKTEDLKKLEEDFKICDLLYHYADAFTDRSHTGEILSRKSQISSAIMKILSKEKLENKTCRYCGKALPFRYPYGICKNCFSSRPKSRRHK